MKNRGPTGRPCQFDKMKTVPKRGGGGVSQPVNVRNVGAVHLKWLILLYILNHNF